MTCKSVVNCRMLLCWILLQLVLLQISWALPIPPRIRSLLLNKGRQDLVARFENIPSLPAEEFIRRFQEAGAQRVVGAGYNGIAFRDSNDRVTKFSFGIYAALGLARLNPIVSRVREDQLPLLQQQWQALLDCRDIAETSVAQVRKIDEPVGSQPVDEELLGTLLWSAYNPRPTSFPDMVSNDGLAFRNRFIQGVPLKNILESQRDGTPLHLSYNWHKLWKQVVFWQRVGETMLQDTGVTVDMFTPGNLIVSGTFDEPTIELIDNAIARPSPQALAYYRDRGWRLPEPAFADELKLIVWPTMSEHIVSNKLWGLDFNQAIAYVKAYYDLSTTAEALERMASFDEWAIVEAPFLGDYRNIRKARLFAAARNGHDLDPERKAQLLERCARLLTSE